MKKVIFAIILIALLIAVAAALLWPHTSTAPQNQQSSPPKESSAIDERLKTMSLRDKVASLFVLHAGGTDAKALESFINRYQPGGFILMGDNIPNSDDKLRTTTSILRGDDEKFPRLVAIDQEGGAVRRLKGDTFPSAEDLRNQPVDATRQAFVSRSSLVQSVGVTLNFGIIADTTSDTSSFIYNRVLGTTPSRAADRVAAAVTGTNGKTLSTLKHFPGHGETEANSHVTIPTASISYDAWQQRDAPPFQAGIDAGADVIMMGHLRYSAVDNNPASLSKKWHDILRNGLHFNGVIITDDMIMLQNSGEKPYHDPVANAVAALNAGNTLLLYVLDNDNAANTKINPDTLIGGIVAAVKSGKISQSVIDNDARQALELRARTAGLVHP